MRVYISGVAQAIELREAPRNKPNLKLLSRGTCIAYLPGSMGVAVGDGVIYAYYRLVSRNKDHYLFRYNNRQEEKRNENHNYYGFAYSIAIKLLQ